MSQFSARRSMCNSLLALNPAGAGLQGPPRCPDQDQDHGQSRIVVLTHPHNLSGMLAATITPPYTFSGWDLAAQGPWAWRCSICDRTPGLRDGADGSRAPGNCRSWFSTSAGAVRLGIRQGDVGTRLSPWPVLPHPPAEWLPPAAPPPAAAAAPAAPPPACQPG